MTFKRLSSPSAGDSTHFGGLDVNKFSDFLGGTDISGTETIDINTLTAFRNSKFSLRNPANTFSYTFVPSAIGAARNVTLPLLLANDQITMDSHITTLSGKTFDTITNTLKNMGPGASTAVFKDGSTYYAVNARSGAILSSGTTDASVQINAAINGIPNGQGGKVFIYAAKYDCKTTISADIFTTAYHSIALEGEGPGTFLDFTPAGALTAGIDFRVAHPGLRNMRIRGNANVVNLVRARGTYTAGGPNDGYYDSGNVSNVVFDGANTTDNMQNPGDTVTLISGQTGILLNGTLGDFSQFFWRITDCDFRNLSIGIYAYDAYSTSTHQTNNIFRMCETGELINSGQHNIANLWFQGNATNGLYGIRFAAGGPAALFPNIQNVCNIMAELSKTGGAAVINESGTNLRLVNVFNSSALTAQNHFIDKRIVPQVAAQFDAERQAVWLPTLAYGFGYIAGWFTGHNGPGVGIGTMNGNITDFGPAIASSVTVDGAARILDTTATINTMSGIVFTKTDIFWRLSDPDLTVGIYNYDTTALRIFIGLTNLHTAPTATADMLSARAGVGLWIDTAVSTDWKVMHNDGTGVSTVAALSTPTAISAANSVVRIVTDDANSKFTVKLNAIETNVTTNIPSNVTDLGFLISLQNTAAASKKMRVYYAQLKTTK